MPRPRPALPETRLYAPVKKFLESQGFEVKGEVARCDVVARRGDEPPVVVELKRALSLELILQGVERLALTDAVYLAVPAPRRDGPVFDRRLHKLLKRVGLGLLLVHGTRVEAVFDPAPYRPRKNARRARRLLGEFQRRVGDPNTGGSVRIKLVTAYRQEALRIAAALQAHGPQSPRQLRQIADAPKAGRILLDDVYGWFERAARGVYALTPQGLAALTTFAGRFAAPISLAARAS